MRRKLNRCSDLFLVISLIVMTLMVLLEQPILADGMILDAEPNSWTGTPPPHDNLGHISRNSASHGEYIWKDVAGDERTDFTFPDPDTQVDLVEFRITGDGENLYFLAKFSDILQDTGNGALQIQVAIDSDQIFESGELYFGGFSETKVDPEAGWEYLIMTRFGSGNTDIVVWQNGFSTQIYTGIETISASSETVEISLPWSALGMVGPPTHPLRFTVAIFRCNTSDETWESNDQSDALDALTNYSDPGETNSSTFDEISDGTQNYYFDLFFEPDGDVYSSLLISEVLYDPSGSESQAEFIEIFNASPVSINLMPYKVGDEETIDGSEGMMRFPSGSITAGGNVVIAYDANTFQGTYGFYPDFAITGVGVTVPMMENYVAWAIGTSIMLSDGGDEVILLDGQDTVLDVVEYEDSEPEWTDLAGTDFGAVEGSSMERIIAFIDTNDITSDFTTRAGDGTPGHVGGYSLFLPTIFK